MATRSKTANKKPKSTHVVFSSSQPTPQRRAGSVPLRRQDTPHPSRGLATPTGKGKAAPLTFTAPRPLVKRKRTQLLDELSSDEDDDSGAESDRTLPDTTLRFQDEDGIGTEDEDGIGTDQHEQDEAHEDDNRDMQPVLKAPRANVLGAISRVGEQRAWMVFTRKMVANPSPIDPAETATKTFGLFQPLLPLHHGALQLIQNTPQLGMLAVNNGGNLSYAKAMSKTFWLHYRKGKTQYNRSICDGFLADNAPHSIARNVLSSSCGPMELAPALQHLETIENLIEILSGPSLYADTALHKLWVEFHASGMLYGGSTFSKRTHLAEVVDVNYDAYSRLELTDRLSAQAFRHGHTAPYLQQRADKFRQIRKMVRKDRLENLELVRHVILHYITLISHCITLCCIVFLLPN